ncbi:oxidoreductase [Aspergillus pseudodeflectus]|uniref:Oxidoreductase n=1 Tax=Aspergillus pseudodeflectus TaxID=176178 RepID=A0ABR4L481_9EURO
MSASHLKYCHGFLAQQPSIKYFPPSSSEFDSLRQVWNTSGAGTPLAIVQPQSARDVAALIKFVKANSVPFTLRSGGHNLEGRSSVNEALQIDLRALNSVAVAPDRKSATVGGGILQGELGNKLWEEGLATATGSVPSVGYTGWATYGGYGPFSSHWGLGVDQIIGATIVDANGEIQTAGRDLLQGIRGAGGLFGVIVQLTVKVYPLTGFLAGPIIFDSIDIAKTFVDFNTAYTNLLDTEGLPPQLTVQRIVFNSPHGRAFAALFVWSGSESQIDEGKRWAERIASLAPCTMNLVGPTTIPEWFAGSAHLPTGVYGSAWTHNLARIPETIAEVIGRNLARLPTDPATMFSLHQLRRGPSTERTGSEVSSVFATREPHYMLEILGYAAVASAQEEAEKWAAQMAAEIQEVDPENVLPTTYISLYNARRGGSPSRVLDKVYQANAQVVRALKARFDPGNLFSLAVPAME